MVYLPTPLKIWVSWDYDIPDMMGKIIQMFQSTNQEFYIFAVWQRLQNHLGTDPAKLYPNVGMVQQPERPRK